MAKQENRITLPLHVRNRAQQRADELGYGTVLDYLVELVVVDTSPLITRQLAQVSPPPPAQQQAPVITATAGSDWGEV
ncbi:hypothetical protein QGP82_23715 [Leptothoe sp. LEGE 181152]|nr:hypothetical protein [Leptothoe sp. LEGE 181152]